MSFTDKYLDTTHDDRPKLVDEERATRSKNDPEDYVGVPIIVPKMSSVMPGHVAEYELFWLVGMPGPVSHPKHPEKFARECLNFPVSRESTALDLAFVLNAARRARTETPDESKAATEAATTEVEDLLTSMNDGKPGIPEAATALTAADEVDTE